MIDPGWIGSVGPVIVGTAVGLAARRVLAANEARVARNQAEAEADPPPAPAPAPESRPFARPRAPQPAGLRR